MRVKGSSMDIQRTGRLFGWFFIATFVTSIPARILFADALGAGFQSIRFIPGAGLGETSMKLGAILEFGVIATNIATAVVLYPIARRVSERVALGYVTARIMESAFIAIGLLSIISVMSVSATLAGASGARATVLAA